jgi:ankyrin repeat protein
LLDIDQLSDMPGRSASQKAWEQILCKRGTNKELEAFKRFFPSNEALEVWEFTYIHNVVLGVLPLNIGLELQNQQYRAQVNMVDSTGRTPLHWATMRGEEEAVECLLEAGADANVQDDFKNTPLCLAASSGSLHMLERLILAGADVDARNNIGSQAIHYASRHRNDVEPVKVLLRAGASVNSKNNFGHTPLSGAAIKNRHRIGAYLLNHGADTDVSSIHGDTPLFETIMHNSYEFLEILLNKGVCHTRVNAAGSTLFHVAALEADVKTVEILRGARLSGGNPNAKDRNGKTALEISRLRKAAPDGFKEVFERLIDLDHYE